MRDLLGDGSADPAPAWSAVGAAAIVDRMLVSKAAIRDELRSRLAEFAPPGEQLQGLFVDERGQIPFADSTGKPVYVLLTTSYVLFVEIKRFSNTPTRTLIPPLADVSAAGGSPPHEWGLSDSGR